MTEDKKQDRTSERARARDTSELFGKLRSAFADPSRARFDELYTELEWTREGQLADIATRTWCEHQLAREFPGRFKGFLLEPWAYPPVGELAERYNNEPKVFPLAWGNTELTWCLWSDWLWTTATHAPKASFQLEWAVMAPSVRIELDAAYTIHPRIDPKKLREFAKIVRLEWVEDARPSVRQAKAHMYDGTVMTFLSDTRDWLGEDDVPQPGYRLDLI